MNNLLRVQRLQAAFLEGAPGVSHLILLAVPQKNTGEKNLPCSIY
jgi:hypothetical protein